MASINGIEIKGMKSFKGHEGEPLWQGNIYYNGQKLGFWSQDSHGGCDNYDFNLSVLEEAVASYKESDRVEDKYRELTNLDILLYDLIAVTEMEKEYKKNAKAGYLTTAVVTDGYHQFFLGHRSIHREEAEKDLAKMIDECKEKCFKNEKISVKFFNCKADFAIETWAVPCVAKRKGR